jgi:tetratricopeptide (TPR) repeat protein
MQPIKIFLASSSELETDRKAFAECIRRKNQAWHERGVMLDLLIWEDFLDSVSKTRSQDEYNHAVRASDIFVILYFSKVGKYTREEFEIARQQFLTHGERPQIFVFEKHAELNSGNLDINGLISLDAFKKGLNEIGHFPSIYKNEQDLVSQFSEQLEKLDNAGFFPKKVQPETRTDISHLPDLQPHFTGRQPELALLDEAWANPDSNLLQFVAPGGTGKTMLLTYWLHHRLPASTAPAPDAIYAWSFYSQGSDESRQSSSDYFFAAAARFFELELPKEPTERGRELARHLRRQRCLLILDGTEPLQYPPGTPGGLSGKLKDPALTALLRELALSQPGLCLLSTRVAIENLAGIEAPMHLCRHLADLSPQDGALLLQQLGVRGKSSELEAASIEYKSHALALRLLGNYLADLLDGDIRKRDRIPHLSEDERQGYHARRVMQAYAQWFEQAHREAGGSGTPPELTLLRLMGLFDRPAPVAALEVLAAPPAMEGLSDGLADLTPERLHRAFKHLKTLGLLEENRQKAGAIPKNLTHLRAFNTLESIDAHPLVREHFGQELESARPDAWREANTRLYHYYKNLPEKELPDTIEEMEPLFTAMAFGARAGLQQEVLDEVYWVRIKRKEKNYSLNQLGAFGTDLAGLATMFEQPWSQPSKNMSEADQALVLSWAGFRLRGLGRLQEAAEPMQAGMKMSESQNDWKGTAQDASNLSELYLSLGALREALDYGRQAVDFADRSGDSFLKEAFRTTLADALHQSGQNAEAAQLFAEAEAMQRERQPEYRFLYSLRGYQYCDLLLGQGQWAAVLERAEEGLKNADTFYSLLSIALDQLSIARAHAAAAQSDDTPTHRDAADQYFNLAVEGLRKAGVMDMVARGLLARANWRLQTGHLHAALEDLQEVYEIADSGSMGLYLVDWHIAMSRLRGLEGNAAAAAEHKAEALRRIQETGYLRRQAEAL